MKATADDLDKLLDNVWNDGASLAGGSYIKGANPNAIPEAKQAILALVLGALPKDDIDEELSAVYDLNIPQEVAGFRVGIKQAEANIRRVLGGNDE